MPSWNQIQQRSTRSKYSIRVLRSMSVMHKALKILIFHRSQFVKPFLLFKKLGIGSHHYGIFSPNKDMLNFILENIDKEIFNIFLHLLYLWGKNGNCTNTYTWKKFNVNKIVYIGSWKRVPLNGMVTSPFLKFL